MKTILIVALVAACFCVAIDPSVAHAFTAQLPLAGAPADGLAGLTMAAAILGAAPANRVRGVRSVRADATGANQILNDLRKAFEDFKAERDDEIKALRRGQEDVVRTEKVDRINAEVGNLQKALDEVNATIAALRVGAGAGQGVDPDVQAHRDAFNTWFRKGDRAVDADLRDLQVKAKLTTQSDPDGGYLVPTEVETAIDRVLGTVSAVRSLSRVISISTDEYEKLVNMGGAGSGWVGEEDARPKTDTPTLRKIVVNSGELYASPAATQRSLDDARLDVAAWLSEEVSIEFAEQEGDAFVNGNGVKKPRGILQYDTVANTSYAWGKLGFVVTGGAAGFASSNPADALIDLYYALKAGYRNGASWLTSDAVAGTIRKFKDGQGNYLWAPPTGPDMPATILGKPVASDDNMPALAANAFPVAFGNFQRGYLITDRQGIRVLRDPYTDKPNVLFYTTKRVGGGVVNFEAIKLLRCAAS